MYLQDVVDDRMQCGLIDFFCIWDLYQQYLQNEQVMATRFELMCYFITIGFSSAGNAERTLCLADQLRKRQPQLG